MAAKKNGKRPDKPKSDAATALAAVRARSVELKKTIKAAKKELRAVRRELKAAKKEARKQLKAARTATRKQAARVQAVVRRKRQALAAKIAPKPAVKKSAKTSARKVPVKKVAAVKTPVARATPVIEPVSVTRVARVPAPARPDSALTLGSTGVVTERRPTGGQSRSGNSES